MVRLYGAGADHRHAGLACDCRLLLIVVGQSSGAAVLAIRQFHRLCNSDCTLLRIPQAAQWASGARSRAGTRRVVWLWASAAQRMSQIRLPTRIWYWSEGANQLNLDMLDHGVRLLWML